MGTTNKPRKVQVRDHAVADSEIAAIWRALDGANDDYAAILKLLILTGARRDEIASLQRAAIDAALITLPAARCKSNREHLIPLSRPALAILRAQLQRRPDRRFVFGHGAGGFGGFVKVLEKLFSAAAGAAASRRQVRGARAGIVSKYIH